MSVTPFDANLKLDLSSFESFLNWQIESGISGIIILGSTGEFLSVDDKERNTLIKSAVSIINNRVPLLVGTGAESSKQGVGYCLEAEDLGADGFLIIPPFYSTPTEQELVFHFQSIAGKVQSPIMLYNNPATSNVDMRPDLLSKLSNFNHIEYVKESTMDVTRVRDIHILSKGNLKVFGGILGFESFVNGACGWTSVAANVMPEKCNLIYTLVEKGEIKKAFEIYKRIVPLLQLVGQNRYVSATKYLLQLMGRSAGNPRQPRLPLPTKEKAWARNVYENVIKQQNKFEGK